MHTLTSQDSYQVFCKGYLSEDKIRVLTHLYQPICRYEAISLYLTLYHEIERGRMLNTESTHYRILNICQMTLTQFQDSLSILEGFGLVRTYKKDSSYVYELMLPLTPKKFFNHDVLNTLLYRTLGPSDYEQTKYFFIVPAVDITTYQDVSSRFDEVFHIDLRNASVISKPQNIEEDARKQPEVSYNLQLFYNGIEEYRIPSSAITTEVENAIVSLGVIYNISPLNMRKLVYDVYENGEIKIDDLQERCLRYYEFENQVNLEQVHKENNVVAKQNALTKRDEKIKQLESLSPYQYLKALQKGANPTSRDLALIEKLMTEQKLNSGVVNVLVETVLLLNNGQLPKNHLEYIAGLFARKNIQSVQEAMEEAKQYIASRKTPKQETKKEIIEQLPEIKSQNTTKVSQEQYSELMDEIQKLLKGEN